MKRFEAKDMWPNRRMLSTEWTKHVSNNMYGEKKDTFI